MMRKLVVGCGLDESVSKNKINRDVNLLSTRKTNEHFIPLHAKSMARTCGSVEFCR